MKKFHLTPSVVARVYCHYSLPPNWLVSDLAGLPNINVLYFKLRAQLAAVRIRRVHLVGGFLVLVLHVVAIWIISREIVPNIEPSGASELHVAFIADPPKEKPDEPPPVDLSAIVQQPPDIVIQSESNTSIVFSSSSSVLAPRPDPSHPNAPPSASIALSNVSKLLPVVLKLLVAPDGTVVDANVSQSSGDGEVDDVAMSYVKANWRFLPALVNGRTAIQYWTTVAVRFAA